MLALEFACYCRRPALTRSSCGLLLLTSGVSAEALSDPAAAKHHAPIIVGLAIRVGDRDSDQGESARDCDD